MVGSVMIVDDHALFAQGLAMMLEAKGGFSEIHVCPSPDEAGTFLAGLDPAPALIVSDLYMPGHQPEEFIGKLKATSPGSVLLCVSGSHSVADRARALDSGADHFVQKHADAEALMAAIDLLMQGRVPTPITETAQNGGLTDRQLDVMMRVAMGEANKEIARTLGISPETVKMHLKDLMRKANVSNRMQLTQWAQAQGINLSP